MKAEEVIKVFVGCDPNNCDLEQMMVLDYSIRKHTAAPLEIVWMQLSRNNSSFWYSNSKKGEGWNTAKWATPFSGFRWAIPEYCNYSGRAIYMDADVIVLDDLIKLWLHPIVDQAIVSAKTEADMTRLCTCIWDCEKVQDLLPAVKNFQTDPDGHQKMMDLLKANPQLVTPYENSYNCIDGEGLSVEDIKILHYSDMSTQFSHKFALQRVAQEGFEHWFDGKVIPHPRSDLNELFDQYYQEALAAGYSLENYRIEPFGDFPKKTHKRYKGNKVTRPKSDKKSLLHRWLKT